VIAVFAEMGRWGLFVGVAALVLFLCAKWWQRHRLISELRMARITVPELEQLIDGGAAPAIIDVRSESTRRRDGSIRGALAWPVHAGADGAPDLARDLEVVVYCACPNEVSAALVARQLREAGFTHVRPLHGGIDAWIAAGLPVERGEAAPAA
jgi:rhodanese-related sulfurtransferase